MTFDLGMHTTLTDANSKLDPEVLAFTERITPLLSPNFGAVWNLFTTRDAPMQTDEYEIYNRAYSSPEVTIQASGSSADWDTNSDITALPVSSGTIDRLTIGDVLLVDSEIVVVKAVDRSGNTIDVYERGAGESAAATHGTGAVTAKIVGNAHEEGKVDPEAMAERTNILTNYTQLVEEMVDLSHEDTEQARKLGRTRDILKQEAMERVIEDLARTAIWGVSRAPAVGFPSMTRGFLEHLKLASSLKTAVSGAFTEVVLQNALDAVRAAGGTVNAIVMNVRNKRTFNGFTGADQVQVDRGERVGGHVLDGYLADGFGVIPPVVDKDMPNDMIALVSTRRMLKGWKVGDTLRFVPETNTHSREKKETLQGRFGLAMEGVDKTHYLLTSIT